MAEESEKRKEESGGPRETARLAHAYVLTAGRIEATVNVARESVRFVVRDEYGLERGSCEMWLTEWGHIGDAMVAVAGALEEKLAAVEAVR